MSINFGGPSRGPFPGPIGPGTPPSGRFRNMYQQSPPPNAGPTGRGMYHHKDRAVTFMPNDVKVPRQPKQPDKPLPAYMRYSRKVWEKVKTQHPEMKMWDIGKLIGEQWRNLPEDERQGFFAEYEVEKSEYQEAMKTYHNSSAYRDWLKAKEKAQQALQDQQMMEKMIGTQLPKEEPRFQLQQMEDDDTRDSNQYEGDFSVKHVATARFHRNHKLIAEIFNESTVPDIKSIVTRPRLENLKRQVQSLMQHQRKLESEIQDMEEKFNAKKAKIMKRSEEFEENVKKLSEPLPPIVMSEEVENEEIRESKTPDSKLSPTTTEQKTARDEADSMFLSTNSGASTPVSVKKTSPTSETKLELPEIPADGKPEDKKEDKKSPVAELEIVKTNIVRSSPTNIVRSSPTLPSQQTAFSVSQQHLIAASLVTAVPKDRPMKEERMVIEASVKEGKEKKPDTNKFYDKMETEPSVTS